MPVKRSPRFIEKYLALPEAIRRKTDKALRLLDRDFRHPGLQSKLLVAGPGIYEARVNDHYRLTYQRHGDVLFLRNIDNHDDCLKNP
jgi:mRNA-degrading endonuclease RelE of RelBE toxin-antitoxin system